MFSQLLPIRCWCQGCSNTLKCGEQYTFARPARHNGTGCDEENRVTGISCVGLQICFGFVFDT